MPQSLWIALLLAGLWISESAHASLFSPTPDEITINVDPTFADPILDSSSPPSSALAGPAQEGPVEYTDRFIYDPIVSSPEPIFQPLAAPCLEIAVNLESEATSVTGRLHMNALFLPQ